MSPKIAPTRGNMVKFASSLKLAEKGHDLLEQKRTILLMELMGKIREAKELQRSLEEVFSKAYFSLQMAGLSLGIENVEELSYSVPETDGFTVRLHSVMGVEIPKVDPVNRPPEPCYSFLGTSGTLDASPSRHEVLSSSPGSRGGDPVYRLAVQIRDLPAGERPGRWSYRPAGGCRLDHQRARGDDREDFTRMKMAREGMENEGGGIL